MSQDAHSWQLRRQKVDMPANHTIFTATREQMPMELDVPDLGTAVNTIPGFEGGTWAGHFVIGAGDNPAGNKRNAWFEFSTVPANHTEYESMGFVFPPIYPPLPPPPGTPSPPAPLANFPGGSLARSRVVMAKVEYEYSLGMNPAWEAAPASAQTPTGGPFQPISTIMQDAANTYQNLEGQWKRIGDWLQVSFIGQDTLNDQINIDLNKYPESLEYGVVPSTPSAAEYDGWVTSGTYIIADRTVKKWRGNYFMRVTRKVRAQ